MSCSTTVDATISLHTVYIACYRLLTVCFKLLRLWGYSGMNNCTLTRLGRKHSRNRLQPTLEGFCVSLYPSSLCSGGENPDVMQCSVNSHKTNSDCYISTLSSTSLLLFVFYFMFLLPSPWYIRSDLKYIFSTFTSVLIYFWEKPLKLSSLAVSTSESCSLSNGCTHVRKLFSD